MKKQSQKKEILAIIPARAGSKGLPGKNIRPLNGKPLIAHTIEHALSSPTITRTVVSTDSEEIARISKEWGAEVPFLRPNHLADDSAGMASVLLHCLETLLQMESYRPDIVVLLQPTCPIRKSDDIEMALDRIVSGNAKALVSVTRTKANPYFTLIEVKNGIPELVKPSNYVTRQEAPEVFQLNGSIFAWDTDVLISEKATLTKVSEIYIMDREHSVDIDDEHDFRLAELILNNESSF